MCLCNTEEEKVLICICWPQYVYYMYLFLSRLQILVFWLKLDPLFEKLGSGSWIQSGIWVIHSNEIYTYLYEFLSELRIRIWSDSGVFSGVGSGPFF